MQPSAYQTINSRQVWDAQIQADEHLRNKITGGEVPLWVRTMWSALPADDSYYDRSGVGIARVQRRLKSAGLEGMARDVAPR